MTYFMIQRCTACGAAGYPRRTLCRRCLADALVDEAAGAGRILAVARLHRSFEQAFADRLPMLIGTVLLDAGPHLHCFLAPDARAGDRVGIACVADGDGGILAHAEPEG
ncbi:Zn-ribbon domain-containing OB-fold protein [Sphingomonas sp.]|uniref:Zn-ribbon domain-containing OB-fold protein n=1 Tax=Sphingomonas sp. TaxID=28214 RepID=UPI002DD63580|nr:zinc ribbon domain-containing protein [Sphingomonas sp.]